MNMANLNEEQYRAILYLAKKAKNGDYVSYQTFIEENYLDLDLRKSDDRNIMSRLLGSLSEYTVTMCVPHMISSVVVHQDFKQRIPGPGFFELASRIFGYKTKMNKYDFWKQEWIRACQFWKSEKGAEEYERLKKEYHEKLGLK